MKINPYTYYKQSYPDDPLDYTIYQTDDKYVYEVYFYVDGQGQKFSESNRLFTRKKFEDLTTEDLFKELTREQAFLEML